MRVRPLCEYGSQSCTITHGSHHIRYVAPSWILRLTTDISVTAVLQETPFPRRPQPRLSWDRTKPFRMPSANFPAVFWMKPLPAGVTGCRDLSIPFEWQEEVIRAAITLKLNTFQDTGAIIAAMTTSIPEAPGSATQLGLPLLLA
ncbi:MAG: hypothetical protein MZV70_51005 [Desulfobacterales bacterium]|nr:hypothetical protein [Desulfobacterales bacterium]